MLGGIVKYTKMLLVRVDPTLKLALFAHASGTWGMSRLVRELLVEAMVRRGMLPENYMESIGGNVGNGK